MPTPHLYPHGLAGNRISDWGSVGVGDGEVEAGVVGEIGGAAVVDGDGDMVTAASV